MKILLLLGLYCLPVYANAAEKSDIPLIDLRARSIRLTRAAASQKSGSPTSMPSTQATQPQSMPPQAPVVNAPSRPTQPIITYTPPPPRENKIIEPNDTSPNSDSDEISEYIENNPQVKPDV